MTFKPTHRITTDHIGLDKGELVQQIGVSDSGLKYGDKYISEDGRRADVQDKFVEPIEQENLVTELIPGKHYRVTVEGVARNSHELPLGHGVCLYNNVLDIAKVELLSDPLPTTPGSRARIGDDTFVRNEPDPDYVEYAWVRINRVRAGVAVYRSDAEMIAAGAVPIHDAGAE